MDWIRSIDMVVQETDSETLIYIASGSQDRNIRVWRINPLDQAKGSEIQLTGIAESSIHGNLDDEAMDEAKYAAKNADVLGVIDDLSFVFWQPYRLVCTNARAFDKNVSVYFDHEKVGLFFGYRGSYK